MDRNIKSHLIFKNHYLNMYYCLNFLVYNIYKTQIHSLNIFMYSFFLIIIKILLLI